MMTRQPKPNTLKTPKAELMATYETLKATCENLMFELECDSDKVETSTLKDFRDMLQGYKEKADHLIDTLDTFIVDEFTSRFDDVCDLDDELYNIEQDSITLINKAQDVYDYCDKHIERLDEVMGNTYLRW
jgi:hypothetical protein